MYIIFNIQQKKYPYNKFRNIIEEYAELGMSLLLRELKDGTDHSQTLLGIIIDNNTTPTD